MTDLIRIVLTSSLFAFLTPSFHAQGQDAQPPEQPAEPAQDDAPAPPPSPRVRPAATELTPNLGWLNTAEPLRFSDQLKGQVVVLDFWTSCCINCMHTIEDLKILEEKYKDKPVVFIGVHSAKFTGEMERRAIRAAVQRYGVKHPVVIDDKMAIWGAYDIGGWPSFIVIGPDGLVLARTSGEGRREILDATIRNVLEYGRKRNLLAEKPLGATPDASVPSASGLAFPGKVHAVAPAPGGGPDARGWLFIADSSHNRVIAATWPDADGRSEIGRVVGGLGGESGFIDGPPDAARFYAPQGLAYDAARGVLNVADTKNHAVRAVSTRDWSVRTLAGDGTRGLDLAGGKAGRDQPIASPWDVALFPDGRSLAVAMAGAHQLWTIDLESGIARPLAGAGGESLFDGDASNAALAQPSGLAFNASGDRLSFVDAETSSVRELDLKAETVTTLVGHDLFVFGNGDGPGRNALLQHPLGVSLFTPGPSSDGTLLIADTYNHTLRLVDGKSRDVTTWAGQCRGETDPVFPGLRFDEPGGVHVAGAGADRRVFVADTNNHRVVVIDPTTRAWREIALTGLDTVDGERVMSAETPRVQAPLLPGREAELHVTPGLPPGTHINPEAPVTLAVREVNKDGRVGAAVTQRTLRATDLPVPITLPASAVREGSLMVVEVSFGVCSDGANATCAPGWSAWIVTITPGTESSATLR